MSMHLQRRKHGWHRCRLSPGRDTLGIGLGRRLLLPRHLNKRQSHYSLGFFLHRTRLHKRDI
jgi:hypothetical protein